MYLASKHLCAVAALLEAWFPSAAAAALGRSAPAAGAAERISHLDSALGAAAVASAAASVPVDPPTYTLPPLQVPIPPLCLNTRARTIAHARTHARAFARAHTHTTHARTHTHTTHTPHTHTHTHNAHHTHAHTRTHTHTHVHRGFLDGVAVFFGNSDPSKRLAPFHKYLCPDSPPCTR